MDIDKLQSAAAVWVKGFVKCFLRVPQAIGLNCSWHTAQASKGEHSENTLQNLLLNLPPQTVAYEGSFCTRSHWIQIALANVAKMSWRKVWKNIWYMQPCIQIFFIMSCRGWSSEEQTLDRDNTNKVQPSSAQPRRSIQNFQSHRSWDFVMFCFGSSPALPGQQLAAGAAHKPGGNSLKLIRKTSMNDGMGDSVHHFAA